MSVTKSFTINSPIDDTTNTIPTIDIAHAASTRTIIRTAFYEE